MDALLDRVRREVHRVLREVAEQRMARVTSFDPATHSIKALILPEADFPLADGDIAETGWIPMGPVAGGNNWGIYAPPLPGTQIMAGHQESAAGSAVGITSVNDQQNPPPGCPAGEIWLMNSSNQHVIKLMNNGTLAIGGHTEIDLTGPTIKIIATTEIDITAPTVNVSATTAINITSPTVAITGTTLTHNGVNIGSTHVHQVVSIGAPTLVPQ